MKDGENTTAGCMVPDAWLFQVHQQDAAPDPMPLYLDGEWMCYPARGADGVPNQYPVPVDALPEVDVYNQRANPYAVPDACVMEVIALLRQPAIPHNTLDTTQQSVSDFFSSQQHATDALASLYTSWDRRVLWFALCMGCTLCVFATTLTIIGCLPL